jgi:hypothetical protein
MLGVIGGLAAGVLDAGPGMTYLIAFGLGSVGLGLILGPDRLRLWRELHGPSSRRRP